MQAFTPPFACKITPAIMNTKRIPLKLLTKVQIWSLFWLRKFWAQSCAWLSNTEVIDSSMRQAIRKKAINSVTKTNETINACHLDVVEFQKIRTVKKFSWNLKLSKTFTSVPSDVLKVSETSKTTWTIPEGTTTIGKSIRIPTEIDFGQLYCCSNCGP